MRLRPARIVRATNEQELDSALSSADQVIVEGDDRLLSYAVAKASTDSENQIAIELRPRSFSVGDYAANVITDSPEAHIGPSSADFEKSRIADVREIRASLRFPKSRTVRILLFVLPLLVLLVASASYWSIQQVHQTSAGSSSPVITGGGTGVVKVEPSSVPSNDVYSGLQALAWPAVSIVAIVALFLIARQAIAGGRNVEISWKVTEKVSGRVVITKVRTRATKQRVAAA
jgi:hypothetical protein